MRTALLLLFVFVAAGQRTEDEIAAMQARFREAAGKVTRLKPAQFPELPADIRKELEQRGCTIPQVPAYFSGQEKQHNVVRGEFARRGQIDWAAVCSREHKSQVLVFWGGEARCEKEFFPTEELDLMQNMGEPQGIAYSQKLAVASPEYIMQKHEDYDVPLPLVPEHQGLEIMFVGKASSICYCHEGKWVQMQGAD